MILVNARDGDPLVDEIMDLGHDLNEGMVLNMGGSYYVGDDALYVLALLSRRRSVFGIINGFLFSSRAVSWLGYPLLKLGRWFVLRLKGIAPIKQVNVGVADRLVETCTSQPLAAIHIAIALLPLDKYSA